MKFTVLLLALLACTLPAAYAQLPAVISAPIAEGISRKQVVHQGISASLLATGKKFAGDMNVVSGQIKGVMDKTQLLHDQWYSSLLKISTGIRNYRRVKEIYDTQTAMLREYGTVQNRLGKQGLRPDQLVQTGQTYANILTENIGLMQELVSVLSAGHAKMTDPERLEFINNIADNMSSQQQLMSYFTDKCLALAQHQQQQATDVQSLQALTKGK